MKKEIVSSRLHILVDQLSASLAEDYESGVVDFGAMEYGRNLRGDDEISRKYVKETALQGCLLVKRQQNFGLLKLLSDIFESELFVVGEIPSLPERAMGKVLLPYKKTIFQYTGDDGDEHFCLCEQLDCGGVISHLYRRYNGESAYCCLNPVLLTPKGEVRALFRKPKPLFGWELYDEYTERCRMHFAGIGKVHKPLPEAFYLGNDADSYRKGADVARSVSFFLQCKNVKSHKNEIPKRLNVAREKKGRLHFFSFHTLHILHREVVANSGESGARRIPPRLHMRRAHVREYSPGLFTVVSQCAVGDVGRGYIGKMYCVNA